jgi:ABC-2 family transporter protein
MNAPTALLTIRWLVRDTFRQAVASRISWLMLLVSALAVVVCLSLGVAGDDPSRTGKVEGYQGKIEIIPQSERLKRLPGDFYDAGDKALVPKGNMTLLFGALEVPLARDRVQMVRYVQWILAAAVADTAGLVLALIFTSSFLPNFLETSNIAVLLVKPIPRWSLLAGKFLGVLLWVLVQATIFVMGTWIALGVTTHVWDPLYLFCIPMLLLHFAIFFSFSTFLAVWTRSTVACVFGSILFWLMCWGMNYGHHIFLARQLELPRVRFQTSDLMFIAAAPGAGLPGSTPWPALAYLGERPKAPAQVTTPAASALMEVGYWVMPKPADLGILLSDSLQANNLLSRMAESKTLREHGAFHPELSILSSLIFMVVLLGLAGYEFVKTDY